MADEPSVILIRGVADALRRRLRLVVVVALAVSLLFWLATGVYVVDSDSTGSVRRFGRLLDATVGPGLNPGWPGPIDRVSIVRTSEALRMEIRGDDSTALSLLTGDENVIEVALVVQYRISRPGEFLFATEDPAALLEQAARAALVREVAKVPVDRVLTDGKAAIEHAVREEAQAAIERYGSGLFVIAVSLATVSPPYEAATAFRAVSDARAEGARLVSDAESERARSLSLARGEANRLVQEAEANAKARAERARGEAARFRKILEEGRRSPETLRLDLWLETVARVLGRTRVVLLAPGENPRIEVNLDGGADRERPQYDHP